MAMKRLWITFTISLILLTSCTSPPPVPTSTQEPAPSPKPASFSVSNLTISPREMIGLATVTIEAIVTNSGESTGICDVILKVDGVVKAKEQVSLAGGTSQKVTFQRIFFGVKTYTIDVNGQLSTLVVKPTPPPPPPPPPPPLPPMDAFMKGIAYNDEAFEEAWPVMPRPPVYGPLYYAPQVDASLKNLQRRVPTGFQLL